MNWGTLTLNITTWFRPIFNLLSIETCLVLSFHIIPESTCINSFLHIANYVEGSNPHIKGQKTRIISPDVQPSATGHKCVKFWYSMYGMTVYILNLYVQTGNTLSRSPIWRKITAQGRPWKMATVDVASQRCL